MWNWNKEQSQCDSNFRYNFRILMGNYFTIDVLTTSMG